LAEQLPPQLMNVPNSPPGFPVTVPLPPRPMDNVYTVVNVAVTFNAPFTVTVQVVCVPVQAPLQPLKTPLEGGVAVRVTVVPAATVAKQVLPQLILTPVPFTLPLPTLVTLIDGTSILAAAFWAPIMPPNSPAWGAAHNGSMQRALWLAASYAPV